jgi:predicted membrane protein
LHKAVKVFLVGMFLGPILAEALGFISSFIMLIDMEVGKSIRLPAAYIGALSSVWFSLALVLAVLETKPIRYKVVVYPVAVLYALSTSYIFMKPDSITETLLFNINYLCGIASLAIAGFLMLHHFKTQCETASKHAK